MEDLGVINGKTRAAYDLAASKYHELFRHEMEEKEYDRLLLDRFASMLPEGGHVLDAGCGPSAHIGRYLLDRGMKVTGIDISPVCVSIASEYNPGMRIIEGDIGRMPFRDGSFDGVISYYSIIDTPKSFVGRLFEEFFRVLRPGGALLVAVKAGTGEGLQRELLGIEADIWFALFSEEEVAGYIRDGGLDLVSMERRDPYGFEIENERIFAVGRRPFEAGG